MLKQLNGSGDLVALWVTPSEMKYLKRALRDYLVAEADPSAENEFMGIPVRVHPQAETITDLIAPNPGEREGG